MKSIKEQVLKEISSIVAYDVGYEEFVKHIIDLTIRKTKEQDFQIIKDVVKKLLISSKK